MSPAAVLKDWHAILACIPRKLRDALNPDAPPHNWRYSHAALNMMRRMGWKGGGIGRREDGRAEPVPAPTPGRDQHAGLGSKSQMRARGGGKSKSSNDKLRVTVETGDVWTYGFPTPAGFERVELTVKGLTRRTGELLAG